MKFVWSIWKELNDFTNDFAEDSYWATLLIVLTKLDCSFHCCKFLPTSCEGVVFALFKQSQKNRSLKALLMFVHRYSAKIPELSLTFDSNINIYPFLIELLFFSKFLQCLPYQTFAFLMVFRLLGEYDILPVEIDLKNWVVYQYLNWSFHI